MRPSTLVLIFLVFLNAASGAFVASGGAEDMGIQPDPGGSKEVEAANQSAGSLNSTGGFGSTLFGSFVSVASWFQKLIGAVFAAPSMFSALGLPGWLVNFIFAPMYIIAAIDIAYILIGRRL